MLCFSKIKTQKKRAALVTPSCSHVILSGLLLLHRLLLARSGVPRVCLCRSVREASAGESEDGENTNRGGCSDERRGELPSPPLPEKTHTHTHTHTRKHSNGKKTALAGFCGRCSHQPHTRVTSEAQVGLTDCRRRPHVAENKMPAADAKPLACEVRIVDRSFRREQTSRGRFVPTDLTRRKGRADINNTKSNQKLR